MTKKPKIDLVSLGTGNGTSYIYAGRPSSSFAIRVDEMPVLLVDIGVGVALAATRYLEGGIPDSIYISHNHLDHSGDLPIVLAAESAQGRRLRILGHPDVLERIISHRIHELYSTGKSYSDFAEWVRADSTGKIRVSSELTLHLIKSQHSELCYGFLMRLCAEPILGFAGDSGFDASLYEKLVEAKVVLVDARREGNKEHASFSEVQSFFEDHHDIKVLITGHDQDYFDFQNDNIRFLESGGVVRLQ